MRIPLNNLSKNLFSKVWRIQNWKAIFTLKYWLWMVTRLMTLLTLRILDWLNKTAKGKWRSKNVGCEEANSFVIRRLLSPTNVASVDLECAVLVEEACDSTSDTLLTYLAFSQIVDEFENKLQSLWNDDSSLDITRGRCFLFQWHVSAAFKMYSRVLLVRHIMGLYKVVLIPN